MTYCLSTCLKAHYLYIHLKPYTVLLFASRLIILILALSLTLSSHFLWDYLYIFPKTHYLYTYLNIAFTYVYWTVHHLDSWIKRDQLDVTCFIISLFNAQHVSDVNTPILRSLRLICWVISWVVLLWFDVCWCYVVVRLWWCGIRVQAEALFQPAVVLQPAYGYHTITAKPQCNTNTHRTRAIQPMK